MEDKKKILKIGSEGASVVELAVIIPMIWLILMGCILFLFFFLDMSVLRSETSRTSNHIASMWQSTEGRSLAEEKTILRKRIEERLILARLEKETVTVSMDTVTVRADIIFTLSGKGLTFSNVSKSSIGNREKWFRILSYY